MKDFKVVIVDDAIFMRTLLRRMIEEIEGCTIVGEAGNGIEAVEQAKKFKPDVMTMDITMPDMDGITAVKEVLEICPDIKILMVSAMGQQSMVLDAIKNGAKDFIVKPFDKTRVVEAICQVVEK